MVAFSSRGGSFRATPICTTVVQIQRARLEGPPEPHTQKPIFETLACVVLVLVAVPFAW